MSVEIYKDQCQASGILFHNVSQKVLFEGQKVMQSNRGIHLSHNVNLKSGAAPHDLAAQTTQPVTNNLS